MVMPKLAAAIGLNEAIVLQQIHYWVEKFKEVKDAHHKQNGQWWVWNTGSEWQENFPFWSERTVWRVIESLRKPHEATETDKRVTRKALIITGNYNQKGYDKTLWYRIDYDELEQVEKAYCQVVNMALPSCHDGIDNLATPIPETTTETTSEKNTPPDGEKSESEILPDDEIEWSTPTTPAQQPTKEERLKSLQAIAGRDVGEGVIKTHENAAPDEWVTVADAYCACILGVRLSDMPESNQHHWPRKLKTIAENIGASSAQMIEALRVMPEKYSGVAFKIPGAYSSPYAGAFEPDVTMVIAKIAAGQLTARGSPVIEMRGRSQ